MEEKFLNELYGIGAVLRFILRIASLPVQVVFTLLILVSGFICRLVNIVYMLQAVFFVNGSIYVHLSMDLYLLDGNRGIVGIIVAVVSQALTFWGEEGLAG